VSLPFQPLPSVTQRAIVLDANILIRAVLGEQVRRLIAGHAAVVCFFAPDAAYAEARKHLPAVVSKRGGDAEHVLAALDALETLVLPLDAELYGRFEKPAMARIGERDPRDWPALACALMLDCPVWTEDADFFGTGVATWTTSRIRIYLSSDE
jgi:predicted nucleic acid-binding protein